MLGMASNAKEKQRKGERKSSRGSREKKEGNEQMRKRGRGEEEERRDSWQGSSPALVITQWLNQLTPLDAGRGRLASLRLAMPRHAHTHSVLPQKLVACSFGRSLGWVSCIGCFSGAASVISSIIIVGSIKTKSQIKLLLQHATCNKNGDNVSIVVVVFMLCLCPPARLTTSAASATLPTACDTPFPPGQVESY